MGIRLSDDEAWEHIAGSLTGIVTTLRGDGSPVTLPVWFVVIDRAVYVRSSARSKKVTRVRHDSRAAFLAESGSCWRELKAVSFTATASIVDDPGQHARALAMLGDKYRHLRVSRASLPEATVRHYAAEEAIMLTPRGRLLSWDNSRIPVSA
jgi:nitroimidazol reductase NimA-like FMN-containing flavoprotein (pyridoxamine 5'-phosphate oxidase superfamily)